MGYYTCHELSLIGHQSKTELENIIDQLNDDTDAYPGFDYDGRECNGDSSWNDEEKVMRKFSKKYPHVTFKIDCQGDQSDDTYINYYKNGLHTRCNAEVVYEIYDEANLS